MSETEKINCNYFDGFKLSNHQKSFLWIAAIVYAFDMFDAMMFSYAMPVLQKNWGLSMERLATLNSLTFIGSFFGGILGGWLSDKYGRKKALLGSIMLFSIASFLTAVAQPHHIMILELSRFLTGFGTFAMNVIGMVYIAEMMPTEHRGKYQALTVACGTVGVPLGSILAKFIVPLGSETWRWLFVVGGASILLAILGGKIFDESPRWLVSKGRIKEAEMVVERCVGVKTDLSGYQSHCNKTQSGFLVTIKVMFSKRYIKRTLAVFSVAWGIMLGNSYLLNWMPTLLTGIGMPIATVLMVFSLSNWGTPLGDIFSSFISDKGGRKIPIIVFCVVTGICYFGIGFVGNSVVGFGVLYFLRAIFSGGLLTMMWTYLAEVYPGDIRNSASGIVMGTGRIAVTLSMYTVPICLKSWGFSGLTTVNMLLYVIPAAIILLMGEKTAKISLEDLEIKE